MYSLLFRRTALFQNTIGGHDVHHDGNRSTCHGTTTGSVQTGRGQIGVPPPHGWQIWDPWPLLILKGLEEEGVVDVREGGGRGEGGREARENKARAARRESNAMCWLTNARMRPGANTHVYTRFNVSRIARYRPRYWFISSTSFPGSLSPLHSFKTRTRTPRFLVVKEERLKGRKRMIKETAAASSSLEDIKALR